MKSHHRSMVTMTMAAALLTGLCDVVAAKKNESTPLTECGKSLQANYAKMRETLHQEIEARLPSTIPHKKATFLQARSELAGLVALKEGAPPESHKAFQAVKAIDGARTTLVDLKNLFANEERDSNLMKASILRHGTPCGLAEFAQQSEQENALSEKLFFDRTLMNQLLIAGGREIRTYRKCRYHICTAKRHLPTRQTNPRQCDATIHKRNVAAE